MVIICFSQYVWYHNFSIWLKKILKFILFSGFKSEWSAAPSLSYYSQSCTKLIVTFMTVIYQFIYTSKQWYSAMVKFNFQCWINIRGLKAYSFIYKDVRFRCRWITMLWTWCRLSQCAASIQTLKIAIFILCRSCALHLWVMRCPFLKILPLNVNTCILERNIKVIIENVMLIEGGGRNDSNSKIMIQMMAN